MFDDLEHAMAMYIGNTYDFKPANPEGWRNLSKAIGISFKLLRKELRRQVDSIMGAAAKDH